MTQAITDPKQASAALAELFAPTSAWSSLAALAFPRRAASPISAAWTACITSSLLPARDHALA